MTDKPLERMLLAHNFDIADGSWPPLSRDEFTAIFSAGLPPLAPVQCRSIAHPHWIMEVQFAIADLTPHQVGEQIAQILAAYRRGQSDRPLPALLVLGGSKTTPATSANPEALQLGQWGVDVVETPAADRFLHSINWADTVADRAADSLFKVVINAE